MNISTTDIAFTMLGISLVLALLRVMRGPSLPDRIVGLELTTMLAVGIILVKIVESGTSLMLDVAIVLALVAFLGTITFAYYIERGAGR